MAQDTQLVGKTCFVAGASSGINLGIAKRFAAAGANVVIISRSEEKIAAAAKEVSSFGKPCIGIAADVRDYAAVEAALKANPRPSSVKSTSCSPARPATSSPRRWA
jgi:NAD(P)-dependent dehydrogenase (short-subunit alcohol dehydrogenase family)